MYRIYYCKTKAHRVTLTDSGYALESKECPACRAIAGLSTEPGAHVTNRNVQMSDSERQALTIPFGARAKNFRNAKDVDKRVAAFKAKNPILQEGYKPRSLRQIAREQAKK